MKILLFGSQITIGGAQRVLLDQADWFHTQGHEVMAVFYYDKDGLTEQWQRQHPFPIHVLASYQAGSPVANALKLSQAVLHLRSVIREFQPDVIETFTHDATLFGLPVAAGLNVPVRVAAHHGQFKSLSPLKQKLHSALINSNACDRLVCVSERALNQALAERCKREKISLIYNGIRPIEKNAQLRAETRKALNLNDSDQLVLNVGRLVPEKAQQLLVQAAADVIRQVPNARFAIAGEGPLRESLQNQIEELELTRRFRLLGNRDDIPALLNAADLFVLYSETEGMPISLMEAMSVGLPVIASDLEGCRSLIQDAESGVLLPFGYVEQLAEAIVERLTADSAVNMEMGQRAALSIRTEFTLECSLNKMLALFEDIQRKKSGHRRSRPDRHF